jgi:predicted SAM-dependent methyltransferase
MIEHIDYKTGVQMLAECYRVLRPGGKIRIATPDLAFLIELYRQNKTARQKAYIQWVTDWFIKDAPGYEDTFVINNFVRAWGHTFIYDEKVLRDAMDRVGFTEIRRCALRESSDPELRGLEHERRLPKGFLRLETLVLEGTKPVDRAAAHGNGKAPRKERAS